MEFRRPRLLRCGRHRAVSRITGNHILIDGRLQSSLDDHRDIPHRPRTQPATGLVILAAGFFKLPIQHIQAGSGELRQRHRADVGEDVQAQVLLV
jgi:hypothetical protein